MKLLHQKILRNILFFALFFTTSISWGQYSTGFEENGKPSYASANVTLSGVSWNLTDALIGKTANDVVSGTWSVRVQNSGSMTMQANVANGIGNFSLKYAKYGNDSATSAFKDWIEK